MKLLHYANQICTLPSLLRCPCRFPSIVNCLHENFNSSTSLSERSVTRVDADVVKKALKLAERAGTSWSVQRTGFLAPLGVNAVLQELDTVSEISALPFGGYSHAERQRVVIMREELLDTHKRDLENISEVIAMKVEGNFIMLKMEHSDFLGALTGIGLKREDVGDIILEKDTGCFVFTTPQAALQIERKLSMVRSIPVQAKKISFEKMPLPDIRVKEISSVESSLRLDAISSAAFGLARDKAAACVKAGDVELNWEKAKKPTVDVKVGDVISFKGKGRAAIESIEVTKKLKYSVRLSRIY